MSKTIKISNQFLAIKNLNQMPETLRNVYIFMLYNDINDDF